MITDFTLQRVERLRGKHELETLFVHGRKGYAGSLRLFWLAMPMQQAEDNQKQPSVTSFEQCYVFPSVLFSVPKKFLKRANKRNLVKRRMRESYRLNKAKLLQAASEKRLDIKIAFIYNKSEICDYKLLEKDVKSALDKICKNI